MLHEVVTTEKVRFAYQIRLANPPAYPASKLAG
jgi:hypothetical protein